MYIHEVACSWLSNLIHEKILSEVVHFVFSSSANRHPNLKNVFWQSVLDIPYRVLMQSVS